MARKYPGLYLYFDWLKGLVKLPPDVAMKIIENLYHYAEDGVEPPPLEEVHFNILQDMYMDQLKRSMINAENGRNGGLAKAANERMAKGEEPYPELYEDCKYKSMDRDIMRMLLQERYG